MEDTLLFPTTHGGSLPRPPRIAALLEAAEHGEPPDPQESGSAATEAVEEVLRRQSEAGISIVSDGEVTRASFADARPRLHGFGGTLREWIPPDVRPFDTLAAQLPFQPGRYTLAACDGPVRYAGGAWIDAQIARFKHALSRYPAPAGAFMTAPSPGLLASLGDTHYHDYPALLFAAAAAMRDEYLKITGAGLILQIDSPDLAVGRPMAFPHIPVPDYRSIVSLAIDALNQALDGIPRELLRLHMCYGNYAGPHDRDIPLADIIEVLYQAQVGALVLPFASRRHSHEWRVFTDHELPPGMNIVAGVIDPQSPTIEHPQVVADQLTQLAMIVGAERVIAGTDCGFASAAGTPALPAGIAYPKLASLAEGAQIARTQIASLTPA